MKTMTRRALGAFAILALAGSALAADGPPSPRKERVTFAKGASSATLKGALKGDSDVDYLVRAAAGQTYIARQHGQHRAHARAPGKCSSVTACPSG